MLLTSRSILRGKSNSDITTPTNNCWAGFARSSIASYGQLPSLWHFSVPWIQYYLKGWSQYWILAMVSWVYLVLSWIHLLGRSTTPSHPTPFSAHKCVKYSFFFFLNCLAVVLVWTSSYIPLLLPRYSATRIHISVTSVTSVLLAVLLAVLLTVLLDCFCACAYGLINKLLLLFQI